MSTSAIYAHLMPQPWHDMEKADVLAQPVSDIRDMSDDVATWLWTQFQIRSLFDLATHPVLAAAFHLPVLDTDAKQVRPVPSFAYDKDAKLAGLNSPVSVLNGIGPERSAFMNRNLDIHTIADLRVWPPLLLARALVNEGFVGHAATLTNLPNEATNNNGTPADLLPTNGRFAIENRYFNRIYIDELDIDENDLMKGEVTGPLDIVNDMTDGLPGPALGALMKYEQRWMSEGVALGELLHSLALAPGESTRIAILDWARSMRGSRTENVTQDEGAVNAATNARTTSEAAQATMNEVQSGESTAGGSSTSTSYSATLGASYGPVSGGASASRSKTTTDSYSVSSSKGEREVTSSDLQQINQATQQSASSTRDRRASVIVDVSEDTREEARTRIVVNYNHMHAMTVQYYEVVQIFTVETQLAEVQRVLFLPLRLLSFSNVATIRRFATALGNAALSSKAATALARLNGELRFRKVLSSKGYILELINDGQGGDLEEREVDFSLSTPDEFTVTDEMTITQIEKGYGNLRIEAFVMTMQDGTTRRINNSASARLVLDTPIKLAELRSVSIVTNAKTAAELREVDEKYYAKPEDFYQIGLRFVLGNALSNQRPTLAFGFFVPPGASTYLALEQILADNETFLANHLQENALHYSQAVWLSLSPDEVFHLIARRSFRGLKLIEHIDPRPLTVWGNTLVLRFATPDPRTSSLPEQARQDAERWRQWKARHVDFDQITRQRISAGSGGVFAEAVLGRSNASEKIDLSRFWDWQESPIPHQAPDIAPLVMGQQTNTSAPGSAQGFDPALAQFAPMQALPDPTGNAAILQAIATNNAFRDMSNQAATAVLSGNLATTSNQGMVAGLTASTSAMSIQAALEAERVRAQAQVATAYLTGRSIDSKATSNTQKGGLLNLGSALDAAAAGAKRGAGGSPSSSTSGAEPTGNGTSFLPGSGGGVTAAPNASSAEEAASTYTKRAFANAIGEPPMALLNESPNQHGDLLAGAGAGNASRDDTSDITDAALTRLVLKHRVDAVRDPLDTEELLALNSAFKPSDADKMRFYPNQSPLDGPTPDEQKARAQQRGFSFYIEPAEDQFGFALPPSRTVHPMQYLIYDFPVGSTAITLDDIRPIRDLLHRRADELHTRGYFLRIKVVGFADNNGDPGENHVLRRKRAENVANLLGNSRVVVDDLIFNERYRVSNDTEFGRAVNRSVTVVEFITAGPNANGPVERMPDFAREIIPTSLSIMEQDLATSNHWATRAARALLMEFNAGRCPTEYVPKIHIERFFQIDSKREPGTPIIIGPNEPLPVSVSTMKADLCGKIRHIVRWGQNLDSALDVETGARELKNMMEREIIDAWKGIDNMAGKYAVDLAFDTASNDDPVAHFSAFLMTILTKGTVRMRDSNLIVFARELQRIALSPDGLYERTKTFALERHN